MNYFFSKVYFYLKLYFLLIKTLYKKECYFGPFVGEFGHLLSHIVPFLSYLNSKGIKIHYCGPINHSCFFLDENKKSIIHNYIGLRDFYNEVSPFCNDQNYPQDVKLIIEQFVKNAQNSNLPFWDIRTREFYFNNFRGWTLHNNFLKIYKTTKLKLKRTKPVIALFTSVKKGVNPQNKNQIHSNYRGDDWDYNLLIKSIIDYVSKIYVIGHPAFSEKIPPSKKIVNAISNNNLEILNKCIESDYIITPMSGAHYISVYAKTKVLILLKGEDLDLTNLKKDNLYRKKMKEDYSIIVCKNEKSVVENLKNN